MSDSAAWRRFGLALPAWRNPRPDAVPAELPAGGRRLRFYLVKPSRYDDDGWVMRFRWGVIPNNTLTVVAGLLQAAAARAGVALEVILWDELVDGVLCASVVASVHQRARDEGVQLVIGLAGVQTSQYPRARDLALQFRRLGVAVVVGGFHVSSHPASVDFLNRHGVAVVLGESESTVDALLADLLAGTVRPRYQATSGIRARTGGADIVVPDVAQAPMPLLDDRYVARFFNPTFATLDTSRGCPFVCSYCSVKNVMGRTMRWRDPERVVAWVRDAHDRHGIRNLLVVDDDLYRSPAWEEVLGGLAELRRSGRNVALILQTDIESAAHGIEAGPLASGADERSRRFVQLAAAAGCFEVFMGFESFDPANLEAAQKLHNQERGDRRGAGRDPRAVADRVRERYRRVVANWHEVGVGVHAGFMIGLPFDDAGCGARAARALADIGVDIASFFACTPLPGTEDHDRAVAAGTIREHDFNAYDSTHFVAAHPRLTPEQLAHEYATAYREFYTWRRLAWSLATAHAVPGLGAAARYGMLAQQVYFTYATRRGWHPMMGGLLRLREGERRAAVTDTEAAALYGGDSSMPSAAGS